MQCIQPVHKQLSLRMYFLSNFWTESSSVSNNIKLQIFQKHFQNVQLFCIIPIKWLNIYVDSYATNFIKTVLIFDWRYEVCQWRILKNHWNTLKICLFGQTTKQLLTNFEPWKSWKNKQLWGLGPDPSCLYKKVQLCNVETG